MDIGGHGSDYSEDRGPDGVRAEFAAADADEISGHVGVHHHQDRRDGIAHRRPGEEHCRALEGEWPCRCHASVAVQLVVPAASRELHKVSSSAMLGNELWNRATCARFSAVVFHGARWHSS
jgi:hypothetical protein